MRNELERYRTLLQSAVWQTQSVGTNRLTAKETAWLLSTDSLTVKLKRHCGQFHVELLNQDWYPNPLANESAVLPAGQDYFVREVFLYGNGQRWIFARTVIPASLSRRFPPLLALGQKPLGEFLFEQKFRRDALQWSKINGLAARRSLFYMQADALLVTELFLDDFGYL
ncbi:hypothetical protein A1D23_11395 [Chelonobacter oris]|uniref:chorismate--pyruvate lyase family protein n=1 Tax=Chelonobacter oris TaxID=505317 RepID=UPI00068E2DF8|nr:chorismate lyase [Chelonobacter oris]MDH3001056.1 hypothetical protein [Chelonobacter oris]